MHANRLLMPFVNAYCTVLRKLPPILKQSRDNPRRRGVLAVPQRRPQRHGPRRLPVKIFKSESEHGAMALLIYRQYAPKFYEILRFVCLEKNQTMVDCTHCPGEIWWGTGGEHVPPPPLF